MFPLLGKYSTRNHIDYINTSRLAQSYLQTKVESGKLNGPSTSHGYVILIVSVLKKLDGVLMGQGPHL